MANELWQQRVQAAQQAAAERLGIDVSVMLPPRNPSDGGDAHEAEDAVAEAVVEPAADVVAEAEAVVEAVAPVAVAVAAAATPAQEAPASDAAADRVAAAKARAAAKAANGAAAPASKPIPARATATAEVGQAGMNRREFVTYAWAAALGLLTLEGGLATYLFMYPRFKEGEFGGKFNLGPATILPPEDASPQPDANGKFWLVNTEAGPKAIYMVCTHLGCLYKWEESNSRFECPCHGSKFSREGFYIEGPAPRSLDEFIVEVVENGTTSVTTDSDQGAVPPAVPSPNAEILVNTGKRIPGKPAAESPSNNSL